MSSGAETFDYVIVGAGAAGCVLANRLSADPKINVLVLEAGGHDRRLWIKVPAGFVKTLSNSAVNWCYNSEAEPNLNGRSIICPRGKVLGGSSSINGHLYVRGQRHDYDHWAQLGNRGWSYEDVLPLFKRSERRAGGDPTYRGRDGGLYVEDLRETHELCRVFIEAAGQCGIPHNPDYNGPNQEGACTYQQMMHNGRRWSAADAFLKPALSRPNLTVRTGAFVERIVFDGARAVGIAYRQNGTMAEVRAGRDVILSGGSINSPQLLQLSGVGPAEHLRSLGIEIRHDLSGVGQNLRDHIAGRVSYRVNPCRTLNERARGLPLVREVVKYAFGRTGLLATSPAHAGAFVRSRPGLESPDVQFAFAPASYQRGMTGATPLDPEPGMTCGVWQLRNESRGSVMIKSADPAVAPAIQPNYLSDPIDRDCLVAGLRIAEKILQAPAFAPYRVKRLLPESEIKTDDEWLAFVAEYGSTTYHPIGSCKMGSDPMAVVDDRLRVHGVPGLRVIDASIMPTMVSGNTYAATLMIAEKGADMVKEDQK